jgi:hypothetical protein
MAKYLVEKRVDVCSRPVVDLELYTAGGVYTNPMTVSVCTMEADGYARRLSTLVAATGGQVKLVMDARIKAVYVNGERTQLSDMRDFYVMTDEEYTDSKIQCSVSHEWV